MSELNLGLVNGLVKECVCNFIQELQSTFECQVDGLEIDVRNSEQELTIIYDKKGRKRNESEF